MKFEPHKLARNTDPDTSKQAARSVEELRENHMEKILAQLAIIPKTAEGISDGIDISYVAVNRRLPELERAGKVTRTERRLPNRSGRMAIVWEARW